MSTSPDGDAPAKKRRGSTEDASAPRKRARSKLPPPPTNTQATVRRHWTPEEDNALRAAMAQIVPHRWKLIAERVPGRDHIQCLQRWQKVLDPKLIKVRGPRSAARAVPLPSGFHSPPSPLSPFPPRTRRAPTLTLPRDPPPPPPHPLFTSIPSVTLLPHMRRAYPPP